MWNTLITISCISAAVLVKAELLLWARDESGITIVNRMPNPPQTTDLLVTCPKGFDQRGKYCYYLSRRKASWDEANVDCKKRNSTLAILPDKESVRYLRTYIKTPWFGEVDRWIGARYDPALSAWVWGTTGERITYYGFWRKKFKRDLRWTCAMIATKRSNLWAPIRCYQRKHYICLAVLDDTPSVAYTPPTTDHPTTRRIEETKFISNSDPSGKTRDPTKPQATNPDPIGTNEKIRDLTKMELVRSVSMRTSEI